MPRIGARTEKCFVVAVTGATLAVDYFFNDSQMLTPTTRRFLTCICLRTLAMLAKVEAGWMDAAFGGYLSEKLMEDSVTFGTKTMGYNNQTTI